MAQTSFGRAGRFCPTRRPLFHGVRKGLLFVIDFDGQWSTSTPDRSPPPSPSFRGPVVVAQQRQARGANAATRRMAALSQKAFRRCVALREGMRQEYAFPWPRRQG